MHVLTLLLQIGAILVASRLLGVVVRRLGQPRVIAEIFAGIALGPSALGLLWPAGLGMLFPADSLPVLGMASQLGLVFFMFLVGLEFDPALLRGQGRLSFAVSNAGIVVPFVLGAAFSVPLHPLLAPTGVGLLPFCMFMGAAMSVTAFPVLARILAERHLIRTRVGALTLTSAAVGDVTAWCMLAALVAMVGSAGLGSAALTTGMTVAFILLMWFVARPVLANIGPRGGHGVASDTVSLVVLLLLGSAAITEWIGIHALFGAFFLGAVMPRAHGLPAMLAEKLEDFVTLVLLPLFFAYSGLRTEIGLLSGPADWAMTAGIILVASLGKFGGTAAAARLMGLDLRSSAAIGILMNTRGLMELVVLNIGLDLGILSPRLFAMMVVMALVTTWITSPLLERIFPAAKMLAEEARQEEPTLPTAIPGLLFCVADPTIAAPMTRFAAAWTRRSRAAVWALHLRPVERLSATIREPDAPEVEDEEPLQAVARAAAEAGVEIEPMSFATATPGPDVLEVARLKKAPLLVIGAHRSAFRGETLGGTTREILEGAPGDVGVLLDRGLQEVRTVVLVRGEGVHAEAAARVAARLAAEGAQVRDGTGAEDVDLVVAPFSDRRKVPEDGATWLLVAGD